jgi:hypothetical protein
VTIEPEDLFGSDEERAEYLQAERQHRHATCEMSLHVDAVTGEMSSPSGYFDEEELLFMSLRYSLSRPGLLRDL